MSEWFRIPTHEALARAMEEKGMTRSELSESSGVSYSQICKMLDNPMVGSLETWLKVLEPLGMTLDDVTERRP